MTTLGELVTVAAAAAAHDLTIIEVHDLVQSGEVTAGSYGDLLLVSATSLKEHLTTEGHQS